MKVKEVTILILIDGFLQYSKYYNQSVFKNKVTILILIDGFLQWDFKMELKCLIKSQSLF